MKKLILIIFSIVSTGASAQTENEEVIKLLKRTERVRLYDADPTANEPQDSATVGSVELCNINEDWVSVNEYQIEEREKQLVKENYAYEKTVYVFETDYKFGDNVISFAWTVHYVEEDGKITPFVMYSYYKDFDGAFVLIILQGRENKFL